MDKGYDYESIRIMLNRFGFTAHIRGWGEERRALLTPPDAHPRRWTVERTHSWLNRYRRILIRWKKKAKNYTAFLHFACAQLLFTLLGYSDRLLVCEKVSKELFLTIKWSVILFQR